MKLSLFLLLGLTDFATFVPQVVRHDYYLITTPATWTDAKTYCRSKFTDLAIVQTDDDWYRLNDEAASKGLATTGWVGLYLDVVDWYWTSLSVIVLIPPTFWGPGQPDNAGGNQACVSVNSNGYWEDWSCLDLKPVICFDASGIVGFSAYTMSWWGGQTYCRTNHIDLARATTATQNNQLKQIAIAQGTSWIGLFRDPWLWSDGTVAVAPRWNPGFPNNADHNDNCGSVNNSMFVDRPCDSLFNFFCHSPLKRYQVVRLLIQGDGSVFDPAVQAAILQQIVQKMNQHQYSRATTVTWRVQQDGNIFHKKRMGNHLLIPPNQICTHTGP